MKISTKGVELIKRYEGLSLTAYRCPAGVLTIGYGHTGGVKSGEVITKERAMELLLYDLKTVEVCIGTALPALTQSRFDALCSFVYNVGCGRFLRSTLLKKIKTNPCDSSLRDEFRRWVNGGGKVLPGLVARREDEIKLYFDE